MTASYQAQGLSASDEELLASPYLTRQLIAYIGNKRKLLPLLLRIFRRLEERGPLRSILDPFSGSGAVSRLGRGIGCSVYAGDVEEYARVLGSAYLTNTPEEVEALFDDYGGLSVLLDHFNRLDGEPQNAYISRHYAPAATKGADYRSERLFYTRENALFIDRVREEIERLFPEARAAVSGECRRAKDLLLALLIYEAATHVNTSGVFKACHKGFGGHGRDALRRITEAMQLEYPHLIEGGCGCVAERAEAAHFLRRYSADLCYLDPPYTIHQYGSNYHLLNTIALWDKPPVNNAVNEAGELKEKAGIRRDWTDTRSPFCSRQSAPKALREVLEAADARWILLSYNSEGIIPFSELYELLSEYGAVEIETQDYTVYRGGRQSISRKTYNQEFQLLLTRGAEPGHDQHRRFERFLREQRLLALLREPFVPERLAAEFPAEEGAPHILYLFPSEVPSSSEVSEECSQGPQGPQGQGWPTDRLLRFSRGYSRADLAAYSTEALEECCRKLGRAACTDRREEFRVLFELLQAAGKRGGGERTGGRRDTLRKDERRIMAVLRKFAHRKYAEEFDAECRRLRKLMSKHPGVYAHIEKELPELEELARRRFSG